MSEKHVEMRLRFTAEDEDAARQEIERLEMGSLVTLSVLDFTFDSALIDGNAPE